MGTHWTPPQNTRYDLYSTAFVVILTISIRRLSDNTFQSNSPIFG